MKQSTGDGNTLGLSFAESAASFSKFGVDAIGQIEDKISTGSMQHLSQFVFCSIWLCQLQVLSDGAAHQGIALWHETQFTAHSNLSAGRLDKSEYQAEQRGLSNTSLAHDGSL